MKKVFLTMFTLIVIFFIFKQYNHQSEEYGIFPAQDITNIRNKGFGDNIYEVGDFDWSNTFIEMTGEYTLMKYSKLKDYNQGNYILKTTDFDDNKVLTNSEFKFYSDIGKVWFFGEGKVVDEKYSFFASIVDITKIKTPIKIKLHDENNYIFGYVMCEYRKSINKEIKIYYLPLLKGSDGYSVYFTPKIDDYLLYNFNMFVVFKEDTNNISLEIETDKNHFQYDVDLTETMDLEIKP